MAEPAALATGDPRPGRLAPYLEVVRSRIRAQRSYRTSFAFDMLGSLLVGLTELGEVWVVFHNVTVLGGLTFHEILLVFGLSNLAFSLADMLFGHLDRVPTYVRTGTLEAFYLRPQPVLAQLMVSDVQLRRLARAGVALVALVVGLALNDVVWSPLTALLLVVSVVAGTAIFGGLFVAAGAVQFRLVNGAEVTNSFTYGGSYASMQSAAIYPTALKVTFGYVIPVVFVAYLPALLLLGKAGPPLLPAWLGWFTPLAAVWVWGVALLLWRDGTRHYQSGGG